MSSTPKDCTIPDIPCYWNNAVQQRIILTTEGISPRDKTGAPAAQEALDDELFAIQLHAESILQKRRSLRLFMSGIPDGRPIANGARLIKLPMPRGWHIIVDPRAFWYTIAQHWVTRTQGMLSMQFLDAESSALRLAKRALLTRHNSLSPISAFPPELLSNIFRFNAIMSPPGSDAEDRLGWIRITHVCRYWRDAAIQSPALWNEIDSRHLGLRWAKMMVARSKAVPISIHWQLKRGSKNSVDRLISNSYRIRHLSLSGLQPILLSVVSSQSFSPDILETLKLDDLQTCQTCQKINCVELPSKLVEAPLPSLRCIIISAFCIPWRAPILGASLTHLEIKMGEVDIIETPGISSASYDNSSYDDLLSALERMPALAVLTLDNCFPLQSQPATRTVSLLHLSQLSLLGDWEPCCDVFQQLTIPQTCRLRLHWEYGIEDVPQILPVLKAYFSGQCGRPPFDLLTIVESRESNARLNAWRSRTGVRGFFPEVPPDLSFLLQCDNEDKYFMVPFCDAFPLHTVHTINTDISVGVYPIFSATEWCGVLERCPEVRQARLAGCDAITFCKALGFPMLDKLEYLCIEEFDFSRSMIEGGAHWDCRSALLRGLERRGEVQGLPELSLHIERCRIAPACMEELDASDFAMVSYESLKEEGRDGELGTWQWLTLNEYQMGISSEVEEQEDEDEDEW